MKEYLLLYNQKMGSLYTRRKFLKSCLGVTASLVLMPYADWMEIQSITALGRVAANYISIRKEPSFKAEVIFRRNRDDVINIYYELESEGGINPKWYRVWGGYAHSAYLQPVKLILNTPQVIIPEGGMLTEVSVPYSQAMRFTRAKGWQPIYRLYYGSVHWVTAVEEGPDGDAWYKIVDHFERQYHAKATHLRMVSMEEVSPISTHLERNEKRIAIDIAKQRLCAYEGDELVLETSIASGKRQDEPIAEGEISTETPHGDFLITVKTPSRHMGYRDFTNDMSLYPLAGVPWVCFFHETGVSLHGTFWHDNFGVRVSHGCVNLRLEDAKWIYRWADPKIKADSRQVSDWGTLVQVY